MPLIPPPMMAMLLPSHDGEDVMAVCGVAGEWVSREEGGAGNIRKECMYSLSLIERDFRGGQDFDLRPVRLE